MKMIWTPSVLPDVTALTIDGDDPDADLWLATPPTGLDAMDWQPIVARGPGQEGDTALDAIVPARVIGAAPILQAASEAALWTLRRAIARAFATRPVRFGGEMTPGLLRIERTGADPVEIEAYGRSAVITNQRAAGTLAVMDAEWACRYPYFRDTADTTTSIDESGTAVAANGGDVDAPIIARLYGPAADVRLTNNTTGETFRVVATLTAGQYIEVDTTPFRKSIFRVTVGTGVRENYMGGLDLSDARLFSLWPGNNELLYEATGATGDTHATVLHRDRYNGV